MSQAQLAERLPMAVRTLQAWERGRGTPPPFIERALNDLARELSWELKAPRADKSLLSISAPARSNVEQAIDEHYARQGVRATDGEGNPIDLRLNERIDAPFPPASSWTDEHAGDGYPPQSTDTGDDEPATHELAYVEGDQVP